MEREKERDGSLFDQRKFFILLDYTPLQQGVANTFTKKVIAFLKHGVSVQKNQIFIPPLSFAEAAAGDGSHVSLSKRFPH